MRWIKTQNILVVGGKLGCVEPQIGVPTTQHSNKLYWMCVIVEMMSGHGKWKCDYRVLSVISMLQTHAIMMTAELHSCPLVLYMQQQLNV